MLRLSRAGVATGRRSSSYRPPATGRRRQTRHIVRAGNADAGDCRAQVWSAAASLGFASLVFAWSASAETIVKLGTDDGKPQFVPMEVTIPLGESVTFVNHMGFPHNIIFDDNGVPEGVNAEKLSRERYFNAPGDKYVVTLDMIGEYHYYCEPHQKVGMQGVIIVRQGY